jgi:hypothetical protein
MLEVEIFELVDEIHMSPRKIQGTRIWREKKYFIVELYGVPKMEH